MIVITPGAATTGGVSQGAQAFATLTVEDVDRIRAEAQYVTAVSPVVVSRTQVIAQSGNWRTLINGVDVDYQTIRGWQTDDGAFFGPDDVRGQRLVAVLGKTVAQKLFADQSAVGQEVQVNRVVTLGMLGRLSEGEATLLRERAPVRDAPSFEP